MKQIIFFSFMLILMNILSACSEVTNLVGSDKNPLTDKESTEKDIIFYSKYSDVEIVQKLINKGFNIDIQDSEGYSALMAAAENDDVEIMNLLIENGATVDLQNNYGETALLMAVRKGSYNVIPLLINAGADPYQIDNENNGLLDYAFKGYKKSVKFEDKEETEKILNTLKALHDTNVLLGELPLSYGLTEPFTPLGAAIYLNDPQLVEPIVMSGGYLELYDPYSYDDGVALQELKEQSYGFAGAYQDPPSISNAIVNQCLLFTHSDIPIVKIFGHENFTKEEFTLHCGKVFEQSYFLQKDASQESSVKRDTEKNNIDLQKNPKKVEIAIGKNVILDKNLLLEAGKGRINGIDVSIGESTDTIIPKLGEPLADYSTPEWNTLSLGYDGYVIQGSDEVDIIIVDKTIIHPLLSVQEFKKEYGEPIDEWYSGDYLYMYYKIGGYILDLSFIRDGSIIEEITLSRD